MKIRKIYSFVIIALLVFSGCNDFLEEEPRSILTPDYFETAEGLNYGLTSVYSGLRFEYGTDAGMSHTVCVTDEFIGSGYGSWNPDNNSVYTFYNIRGNSGIASSTWTRSFSYINTCNGIVEYGSDTEDADQLRLVGEAKFLRALYYSKLVQTFGGVPLDLGSGELKYNKTVTKASVRNTVEQVYAVIVQDLKDAIDALPDIPAEVGRAGKGAAIHFLAKTYLAMGEYDLAFNYAKELIDNQAAYGLSLQESYADVNAEGNDDNSEIVFSVQHTSDLTFSEADVNPPNSGMKENRACFFFTPYWEFFPGKDGSMPFTSEARMIYQRPWAQYYPTYWLVNECFADKDNDSRFHSSFRTVWYATIDAGIYQAGDSMFWVPCDNVTQAKRDASKPMIFANSDLWQEPVTGEPVVYKTSSFGGSQYWAPMPPNLTKYDDTHRAHYNYSSTRPFPVAKLSETYLVAAEAALFGSQGMSVGLSYLNTIRKRAAVGSIVAKEQGLAVAEAAMEVTSYDIDFILDERSRELCGEQLRWFDLVRTNKLIERITNYVGGSAANNIKEYHRLRPIPQIHIDLLEVSSREGYQNPGYN